VSSGLYKVEGAGNDFILGVGEWARRLDGETDLVQRLCDRRRGIGADGTLALEALGHDRVRLGYRNADGSVGAFCANGTRCAARAAVEFLGANTKLVVETGWAAIVAEVYGSQVSIELPAPETKPQYPEITAPKGATALCLMKIGVPHMVVATEGLADLDLGLIAPPLRHHAALGSEGANVDFFAVGADASLRVRTWERGVEGETLSCGSGMVAVALVVMAGNGTREAELFPISGDRLTVEALGEPPVCATRLTGPTRFIAQLEPFGDFLHGL
jgi:diaminopimelate epimerase